EERLELDDQRVLLASREPVLDDVPTDAQLLTDGDSHHRTSLGSANVMSSIRWPCSTTSTGPRAPSARTTRVTIASGAEAPAVTPMVMASATQSRRRPSSSSSRWARQPARRTTSTSRFELDEFREPT